MTLVRNPETGVPLACCWDECERSGQNEIREVEADGRNSLTYIFCSQRHLDLWKNARQSYGNLPSGSRSPLGLWIPR